jgi:hypothetical protein
MLAPALLPPHCRLCFTAPLRSLAICDGFDLEVRNLGPENRIELGLDVVRLGLGSIFGPWMLEIA